LSSSLRCRYSNLRIFFPPSASLQLQNVISTCIDDVAAWMRSNRLQRNSAKTKILWFTTSRRLHQLPQTPLRVGSDHVVPCFGGPRHWNIPRFGPLIEVTCRRDRLQLLRDSPILRQLPSVRRSVSRSVLQLLVTSLVMSGLDYGNATLAGISTYLL